jgi:small subunit ribosomal protein S20
MANTLSAEKRIDVNKRNQLRNKAYKSTIRTIYKKCLVAISNKDENNI